jgi:hypothetical protein
LEKEAKTVKAFAATNVAVGRLQRRAPLKLRKADSLALRDDERRKRVPKYVSALNRRLEATAGAVY